MTPKKAAETWQLSVYTVRKYCKDRKIPNVQKIKKGTWEIPDGSIKPLKESEIRKVLLLTLQLKNNPRFPLDWSTYDFSKEDIRKVYDSLAYRKYIDICDVEDIKQIPYEARITEKGMNLIERSKKAKIDVANMANIFAGLATIISSINTILSCQ